MRSSLKNRQIRKKQRNKHRKLRLKKAIKKEMKSLKYLTAFHECGHAASAKRIRPDSTMKLSIELIKGEWTGKLEEPDYIGKQTTADDDGQIAIAGAIAETIYADHPKTAAYSLLKTPSLKGDLRKFEIAHALSRKLNWQRLKDDSQISYFNFLYEKVVISFQQFGLDRMHRFSKHLSNSESLTIK